MDAGREIRVGDRVRLRGRPETAGTVEAVGSGIARVRLAAPEFEELYPGGPTGQPLERPREYLAGLGELEPAPEVA